MPRFTKPLHRSQPHLGGLCIPNPPNPRRARHLLPNRQYPQVQLGLENVHSLCQFGLLVISPWFQNMTYLSASGRIVCWQLHAGHAHIGDTNQNISGGGEVYSELFSLRFKDIQCMTPSKQADRDVRKHNINDGQWGKSANFQRNTLK